LLFGGSSLSPEIVKAGITGVIGVGVPQSPAAVGSGVDFVPGVTGTEDAMSEAEPMLISERHMEGGFTDDEDRPSAGG
jgi:hypothetical protein